MPDLRDASVPSEWLPKFIGHLIWTRPTSAPQIDSARWCELLDVWEAQHTAGEAGWWFLRALVTWEGQPAVTTLARKTHTRGIPAGECTTLPLENGDTLYVWAEPFDDPPALEMRPWDWGPNVESPEEEPTTVPSDVGDQYTLL